MTHRALHVNAVVCRAFGPPESLAVETLPSPTPGPGQVVITVHASGVNFPDTLMVAGKYQFRPPFPFVPGMEVAGEVSRLGEGVAGVRAGDPVMALVEIGGFAEECLAAATSVFPIPTGVGFPEAAAFILVYATGHHALADRGSLRTGETLLVLGAAGGVGLAAIEIGKAIGARVIACASSAEKLEACRAAGADLTINYAAEDLRERIKALTNGRGVDVVYDPVGGPLAEPAIRSLAWRGRYLVVGFASGEIPRIPLNLALLKGASIIGVFWGDFTKREPEAYRASLTQILAWLEKGIVRPRVSATYPLSRAAEALTAMLNRRVVGKLVLVPTEAPG